jgi:hypothetical protein
MITVRGSRIRVESHQIIVWMSVTGTEWAGLEANCPRIPVILDTGNTFTFAITERQLCTWAGLDPRFLNTCLPIDLGGHTIPVREARIWLYPNRPGGRDTFADQPARLLEVRRGIAIYPDGAPNAPRLPILGLRALVENRLHLKVDAERCRVSLRSRDWVTRWFGWW